MATTPGQRPSIFQPQGQRAPIGWGPWSRQWERLRKLVDKGPDPEAEKRDRERVRIKEALERLTSYPEWRVYEDMLEEEFFGAFERVVDKTSDPEVLAVLLSLFQRIEYHVWAGQRAMKRITARRLAAHQRLMQEREPVAAQSAREAEEGADRG
jgi:hypothetical protein